MGEFYKKKKVCPICSKKTVDYKDYATISKFVNEKGKILPSRATGACAKHQRFISNQVKIARFMGILPYTK